MDVIIPLLLLMVGGAVVIFFSLKQRKENEEKERIEQEAIEQRRQLELEYRDLEYDVLQTLDFPEINVVSYVDMHVTVKSRATLDKYDIEKFLKDHRSQLEQITQVIYHKAEVSQTVKQFLFNNNYKTHRQYSKLKGKLESLLKDAEGYRIQVDFVSTAGNHLGSKKLLICKEDIEQVNKDPSILMNKTEYNQYIKQQNEQIKQQNKEQLDKKHRKYCDFANKYIDWINSNKEKMIIKADRDILDNLGRQLFDRANNVLKIKTHDSPEWALTQQFISSVNDEIKKIAARNNQIISYYNSQDFLQIKETCVKIMGTQKEFNEYIEQKAQRIALLFGTRVVRNETVVSDENNYVRPYKKTITPFTAEVSSSVFASAENNPLEYVVKHFYPNKTQYPEQIRNLYTLVQELETLKEAKQIIENYKADYKQYLNNVPAYILEQDEAGFYQKLGFANIDESVLEVEYKFVYTSDGGKAQRSFTVPMTDETIVRLIEILENKLTDAAFRKEQRALMTKALRESIKKRDHYTCCECGNSIHKEPNLLLEIDHIMPISKGGKTEESNLQTLCWKCNRSKGNKILE